MNDEEKVVDYENFFTTAPTLPSPKASEMSQEEGTPVVAQSDNGKEVSTL